MTVLITLRRTRAPQSSYRSPRFSFLPVPSSQYFCLLFPQSPTFPGVFPDSPIQRDIFQQPRQGWTRLISLLRSPNLFEPLRLPNAPVPVARLPRQLPLMGSRSLGDRWPGGRPGPGYGMIPDLAEDSSMARGGSPRAGASIGGPSLPTENRPARK